MTVILFQKWAFNIIIFSSISFFTSCGKIGSTNKVEQLNETKPIDNSYFELCDTIKPNDVPIDTVLIKTVEELRNNIKSNRVLKLAGDKFNLNSPLQIDSIINLSITGTGLSRLMVSEENGTVINVLNSKNIYFTNLVIGHATDQGHIGAQGVIKIEHASNVNIFECRILGFGSIGLITKDVCNLNFKNSEITACTGLLFELERSRKFEFKNAKFYDNNLRTSVLGGFTDSTKEIIFTNCEFLNNKPDMAGNPAFNFYENWENFDEQILFSDCTFKNNKGYKWHGDKIKLDNCKIDSADFIGLQKRN